jgi:hypothetical protein
VTDNNPFVWFTYSLNLTVLYIFVGSNYPLDPVFSPHQKTRTLLEKQFIYEIETLFEYRHPNICALIGHCTERPGGL